MSANTNIYADTVVNHPAMPDTSVEKWGAIEIAFTGPSVGNPFADVTFGAWASQKNRRLYVEGFYAGSGTYKLRFMPDSEGEWSYRTQSSHPELDGLEGGFTATSPAVGNHGPVKVVDSCYMAYADGRFFSNMGTTAYAWLHQGEAMGDQTVATLKASPFNKIRMCVFPKHYRYNENEPSVYPFPVLKTGASQWAGSWNGEEGHGWEFDWERFVPEYFDNIDRRVMQLREIGVEADIIIFHPYDRWGFAGLPEHIENRYLRYIAARLSAYRNVWWSFANEWDLFNKRDVEDWERYARIILECDHANHLRGIHNCRKNYDHSRHWVTHVSFQGHPQDVGKLMKEYHKPVVVDECCYEGDVQEGWGNISGFELAIRFWAAFCQGGYCGHSETYWNEEEQLWWGKGGKLTGQSPERIAFMKSIVEERLDAVFKTYGRQWSWFVSQGEDHHTILGFLYDHQPRETDIILPEGAEYTAEVIDPWEMTITPVAGRFSGDALVPLPCKPYQVIRLRRV